MFDLPSSLKTAIDALTFTPRTVTVFKDEGSTKRALGNLENLKFDDAAVVIGDWLPTSEPRSFGWSTVRNSVELLLCAKGLDAQAALKDGSLAKVICEGLNRTTLNNAHHVRTQIETAKAIEVFNERIHYQILTALVVCVEPASTNFTPMPNANPPQIEIGSTTPVEWTDSWKLEANVGWGDGEDAGVFALAKLTQPYVGQGLSCYIRAESDGTYFTFEDTEAANALFAAEPNGDVLFTIYAFDTNGMFDTAEITIHFTGI